jgi:glycosyltransferase involved in cell wall biosynthesis
MDLDAAQSVSEVRRGPLKPSQATASASAISTLFIHIDREGVAARQDRQILEEFVPKPRYDRGMGPAEPSPRAPTVTVAIPTLGRFEEVRDTLEAILSGTRVPDEILVSDQNRPAIPELDAYLASRSLLIRHLRTEPRGVVFNMNCLLREARGDVILYLDDDVVPTPGLVEAHLRNYADPTMVGVAGRVEQPSGDLPAEEVREVGAFHPWSGRMVFRFNGLRAQDCVFAQGANMSFDRRKLASISGFDEGFIGNGYFFESDATLRLTRAFNRPLRFDPEASLRHLAAPRGGARVHDRAGHHAFYAHNAVRLFRRHCPSPAFPMLVAKLFAETAAKAGYRRSSAILSRGMDALVAGLRQDPAPISSGLALPSSASGSTHA